MSTIRLNLAEVEVKHGDCVPENKLGEGSNAWTKSYFASAKDDFPSLKSFLDDNKEIDYSINLKKVAVYKLIIERYFVQRFPLYKGKGTAFQQNCNFLLEQSENPIIKLSVRVNDERVFMKFADGRDQNVHALRELLFDEISTLILSEKDGVHEIYPSIIYQNLDLTIDAPQSPQLPPAVDRLSIALKLFMEKRSVDKPGGWSSYDDWTKGVRTEFVAVDEVLLDDSSFDYLAYIRKFGISWQVANTKFAAHSDEEKRAVLKFLKGHKDSPKSASWYIDDANRLVVNGNRVKGMSQKAVLYFMSELHPEEFAAWTEPTYEQLEFLGLHNGATPSALTIETYEDCKAKQQLIVAKMKELKIGKASDDSSAPDYRTANEFLWWLGQDDNKDLIKEKVMSKVMKKPTTQKITTGKATISKLLENKEDSLMTMLVAGLLTKPLAILAGVSGTGKSRMVRHLAYKTCLDEDLKPTGESAPGNFKMVQVKPSWHDSADLLGYRSAVNEKHEYVSTDFVKFVLKAHAYPNTPFFVCLDEMNLAPVEHYFAEFLSACESIRKSDVSGEWTSDPIVAATDFDNDVFNLGGDVLFESADAALDAALKTTRARIEKEGLFIPRNLFVVGTVNMDDSTGGFSRKVLDRAMTIVMNEVHFEDLQKEDKDLTLSDDNLFTTAEIAKFIERKDFNKDMMSDAFRDQLENIRQKLAMTPFALAYRFARETCMYKNALKEILDVAEVVKDSEGNPKKDASGAAIDADRACGDIALDHMILMKLLPRLTGTTEQRSDVLKDINEYLGKLVKDKKVSALTLGEMEKRAKGNGGYLSFWP